MEVSNPKAVEAAPDLVVDIVSDVVCPWCYIGKRKLEAALFELETRAPGASIAVRWHPFQLNPDLPAEGVDRIAYLEAKFGSKARADQIYSRVKSVGAEVGIAFDFDRISRVPNTLDAHVLIAWAQQRGAGEAADTLVERLFRAFFIEGRLLGEREELVRIAAEAGLPEQETRSSLESLPVRAEVEAEDREARGVGIGGVPFFIFNGRTAVAGAHDPETLLKAITAARAGD
ncbi:MAG TPA: DsbA family oxidoreductase [Casimicrobiaceae bacterium]|nr:DsbA family oxidoreductase [Casimicrobiaceae bacterium]